MPFFGEFDVLPPGPRLLCGDLNCNTSDLPTLSLRLESGTYIDLGAHAHLFGHAPGQPTCFPTNDGTPSIRDYAIISADLLPFITNFEVLERAEVPVHAPLSLSLSFPTTCPQKVTLIHPNSGLSPTLLATVRALHGLSDQQEISKELLRSTTTLLHARIHDYFIQSAPLLQSALHAGDTTPAWKLWSQCVTKGFPISISLLGGLRCSGTPAHHTFDHVGHPCFTPCRQFKAQTAEGNNITTRPREHQIVSLLKQIRRLQNRISSIKKTE